LIYYNDAQTRYFLEGIGKQMILFPYAENLEYEQDRIKFSMKFFNNSVTTSVNVSFPVDDELKALIEGLFMEPEDEEEKELWTDD